jgi:hypothetical protein
MPENGQNEKKRRLIPFQNGSEVVDSNSNRKTQKVNEHKSNICIQRFWGCRNHVHYSQQICCSSCIDCLKIELDWDSSQRNPTDSSATLSKEEIIDNHMSVLFSFGLFMKNEDWIPKLHKCSYKHRD